MANRVRKTGHYECSECKQSFARADHLQRHRLLHSGIRPYACSFCDELFARCDSLRRHYTGCPARAGRDIPETEQRGRRKHACQPCSTTKLRCEGTFPCKSCVKRGVDCVKPIKTDIPRPAAPTEPKSASSRTTDPGSIGFLLNAGESGFIADWKMPDGNHAPQNDPLPPPPDMSFPVGQAMHSHHYDPTTSGLMQAFEDGPFLSYRQQMDPAMIWPLGVEADTDWGGSLVDTGGPDHVVASALINVLTHAVSRLALDDKTHADMTNDVRFLLTPGRIARYIDSYKTIWHLNCPIVHVASLAPENVQLTLLVPIVLMGAMYSMDEREVAVAKSLLDVAEMYVFSSDVYSPEAEVRRSLEGRTAEDISSWDQYQQFQGGYLMVAFQFWAGNPAARNRAMECRFSEVVKLVRHLGLHKMRHTPEEQYNEELWIQKECKLRTMNILFCLDCAFLFFRSYPCRLSFPELDFEMACEEPVFNSRHPFSHPRFGVRQAVTLKDGVQALSLEKPNKTGPPPPDGSFTMLTMFTLIHVLYAFISNRLSLPYLNIGSGDSFLAKIHTTLDRWKEHWDEALATTSTEAWQMAGLFRSGQKYWMVAQLLVQKHELVEGDELLVPKCEDKWARMRLLA